MEILYQNVDKALCKTNIELGNYVLNPYKGCAIGCRYCYVRSNKGIKKINKEWGEYIIVKKNFISLLEKELNEKNDINRVLIGSTTEPFPPLEELSLTISAIKMLKAKNIPFVMLTRQPVVAKYIDIISYHKENTIYFTVNSETVRAFFEKRSAPQSERIKAIQKLYSAGIKVIAYIGPFFPYITDIERLLESISGRVKKIYIEAYHPKMGNFEEIREILNEKPDVIKIFESKESYCKYWDEVKEKIFTTKKLYDFELKFLVPEYDEYYKNFDY